MPTLRFDGKLWSFDRAEFFLRYRSYEIGKPVDIIIGDIFLSEPLVVCAERQMPYYIFNCASVVAMRPFFEINEDTPVADPSVNPMEAFTTSRPKSVGPPFPVPQMMKMMAISMNKNFKPAKGFLNNSFSELDQEVGCSHRRLLATETFRRFLLGKGFAILETVHK